MNNQKAEIKGISINMNKLSIDLLQNQKVILKDYYKQIDNSFSSLNKEIKELQTVTKTLKNEKEKISSNSDDNKSFINFDLINIGNPLMESILNRNSHKIKFNSVFKLSKYGSQ